jgi:hypothetical protein
MMQPPDAREKTVPDVARDGRGRWLPGVSPNPGGRPVEATEAIRLAASKAPEAIERLWTIATDERVNPSVRVTALVAVLDRGLGKPRQSIDVTAEAVRHDDGFDLAERLASDERAAELANALARHLARDAGEPGALPD